MSPEQIVEAALFASQTPLTAKELARADESLDVRRVREALDALRGHYEDEGRAFQIYHLGDGFQILTRPEFAPYLERFDSVPRPPTLSRAALETLAIIAYGSPSGASNSRRSAGSPPRRCCVRSRTGNSWRSRGGARASGDPSSTARHRGFWIILPCSRSLTCRRPTICRSPSPGRSRRRSRYRRTRRATARPGGLSRALPVPARASPEIPRPGGCGLPPQMRSVDHRGPGPGERTRRHPTRHPRGPRDGARRGRPSTGRTQGGALAGAPQAAGIRLHATRSSGRPTIYDLVPADAHHLPHLGRLDFMSEGLILLSNEGDLANRLLHPSAELDRTYVVELIEPVAADLPARLREGVVLSDGPARARRARWSEDPEPAVRRWRSSSPRDETARSDACWRASRSRSGVCEGPRSAPSNSAPWRPGTPAI